MALMRTRLDVRTLRGPLQGMSFRIRGSTGTVGSSVSRRLRSSEAQLAYRAIFQETIRAWGELNQNDREDWIEWADEYGTAADPDAPVGASGRSRFIGANTLQLAGNRSMIMSPSSDGIGNADAALIAVFPITDTDRAEIQMIQSYPAPEVSPAIAALYASPTQRESSSSNKKRWRKIEDVNVTRGGPSGGIPIRLVDLTEPIGNGEMIWVKTKVVTGAGNTSSDATWPVFMPSIGERRAMRIRPVFDFLSPQRYRIEAGELIIQFTSSEPYDTDLIYDLNAASTDTIGELFAQINTDGVWQSVNLGVGVSNVPSIDLIEVLNTNVTTGQQPSLLRVPE